MDGSDATFGSKTGGEDMEAIAAAEAAAQSDGWGGGNMAMAKTGS